MPHKHFPFLQFTGPFSYDFTITTRHRSVVVRCISPQWKAQRTLEVIFVVQVKISTCVALCMDWLLRLSCGKPNMDVNPYNNTSMKDSTINLTAHLRRSQSTASTDIHLFANKESQKDQSLYLILKIRCSPSNRLSTEWQSMFGTCNCLCSFWLKSFLKWRRKHVKAHQGWSSSRVALDHDQWDFPHYIAAYKTSIPHWSEHNKLQSGRTADPMVCSACTNPALEPVCGVFVNAASSRSLPKPWRRNPRGRISKLGAVEVVSCLLVTGGAFADDQIGVACEEVMWMCLGDLRVKVVFCHCGGSCWAHVGVGELWKK